MRVVLAHDVFYFGGLYASNDWRLTECSSHLHAVVEHFTRRRGTRYAPVSGEQGAPGSKYLLTQKKGDLTFKVTVVARDLSNRVQLETAMVEVRITVTFHAPERAVTRLTSDEVFIFSWPDGKMFELLGGVPFGALIAGRWNRSSDSRKRLAHERRGPSQTLRVQRLGE
jgi:hypothetical protein